MSDLAIVIPAYKEKYFRRTLNSIAQQTNKNFTVYIGDDCSPFNLKGIAYDYAGQFNISYTRFNQNIGARRLVRQWERCIALTGNEKWLWLFSDDDLMDPDCVQCFYDTITAKGDAFDVFRFNTVVIDDTDNVTHRNHIGPDEEDAEQMAYYLLKGERGNSMPDHVYSREVYNKKGFVYTEYAQGADWATSISFAQEKGLCIIKNACVYWRYGGSNISSLAAANKASMINGHLQFLTWTLTHFSYLKKKHAEITYDMMCEALLVNFRDVFRFHYKGFSFNTAFAALAFLHNKLKLSYYDSLREMVKIQEHFVYTIQRAANLWRKVKRN